MTRVRDCRSVSMSNRRGNSLNPQALFNQGSSNVIVRVRFAVAPLLIALLCGAATPASADRDDKRQREPERSQQGGQLRDSYDYRRERQEQWQSGQRQPQRSYPQPGYPNPIQPGYYRHDPYSKQPGRDPYRHDNRGDNRGDYRSGERGGYERGYGQDRDDDRNRNYERERNNDAQRGYPSQGRPLRPVNDVVRQVESTYGGKVVGVQQAGSDYRVRVLQRDGRVKTVTVPAQ